MDVSCISWQLVDVSGESRGRAMAERMFNGTLVAAMGLDALAASKASIRRSIASRAALRDANASLAAATDRLTAAKARLARAKAARAAI